MDTGRLRTVLLCTFAAALWASTVTANVEFGWRAAAMDAAGTEISTDGELVFAYGCKVDYTVNGVPFSGLNAFGVSGVFSVTSGKFYIDDGMPRSVPSGVEAGSDYAKMMGYSFWCMEGEEPIKLKGLEVDEVYLFQIVSRFGESWRNGMIYAPDSQNCYIKPNGTDWTYGGILTGIFVATNEQITLTFNMSNKAAVNAIQLRKLLDVPRETNPTIGSVTAAPSGSSVTLSLSDVKLGSNSAFEPAQRYSVHYSLMNGTPVTALTDQSDEDAVFEIENLADGEYECAVWIVTDTPKTSAMKSVTFSIHSTIGDFDALKAAIEGASDGAVITVSNGLYLATSTITVSSNDLTIVSENGKDVTVIDGQSLNRVFAINGSNCRIEGLTVKKAVKESGYGGAMDIAASARARIVDCDFEDCSASWGGAICCGDNSHTAFDARENYTIVSGCTFLRCSAAVTDNSWGGGGAIHGAVWAENSTFDACFTAPGGKLIYHADIDATSYMTVSNCVFKNHDQTNRGLVGINENRKADGGVRLDGCLIADNTLKSGEDCFMHRRVMLDSCTVSNNSFIGENALMQFFRDETDESHVRSCLFIDNKFPFEFAALPKIENCTFIGNVGGIALNYCPDGMPPITVKNCVFWRNVAYTGPWPYGATYHGIPGFYWHILMDNAILGGAPFVHSVIEGGSADNYMMGLLSTEADRVSEDLTATADAKGKVFWDIDSGDYTPKAVLVDHGVTADWMATARDLLGNPRAIDGMVDIGCIERKRPVTIYIVR